MSGRERALLYRYRFLPEPRALLFARFSTLNSEGELSHSVLARRDADKAADNKQDTELRALALEEAAKEYRTAGNYAQAVAAYQRMLALSTHSLHQARGMTSLGRVLVAMDSLGISD